MRYSGEQYDSYLGQQYLRARYYNQNNGQFNRLDPYSGNLTDPQSLNKYSYCHDDPVNWIDPSGMWSIAELNATNFIRGVINDIYMDATENTLHRMQAMGMDGPLTEYLLALIGVFHFAQIALAVFMIGVVVVKVIKSLPQILRAFKQLFTKADDIIREFDVVAYGKFKDFPGDNLTGHELLQNAWLEANGYGRRGGKISNLNPAIALYEDPIHKAISATQRRLKMNKKNVTGTSANKNILDNLKIMKEVGGVPRDKLAELAREAWRFAKTLD